MHRSVPVLILGLLILTPLSASAATTETTRAQYVKSAEPVCKANTLASQNALRGIHNDVREGKLKLAGGKFGRAARALKDTIGQLELLPRPTKDKARLERWFASLMKEVDLLEKVSQSLRAETKTSIGKFVLEIRHQANVANNIVLTFGFEYCLVQPARYV